MRSFFPCFFLSVCLCAQTTSFGPSLAGAGFSNPYPLPVSPGQLLTLYLETSATGTSAQPSGRETHRNRCLCCKWIQPRIPAARL